MRNEQLIDRLRDLVRRSILMRLLLNTGPPERTASC